MADVTKNASISIKADADAGNIDVFRGKLEGVADAGRKAGEGASQGLGKVAPAADSAEKGLTRYRNALINVIAEARSAGDPVEKQFIKAAYLNKDISALQSLAAEAKLARESQLQLASAQKAAEDQARRQAKEYENLAKQIETARIKAEQGMSAYSADFYRGVAASRNMQLQPQEQANLAAIEHAQQINAQNLAAIRQANAMAQRIAVEERGISAGLQRAIDGFATANMTASERFRYQIQQMGLDIQKFLPQLRQLEAAEQQAARAAAGMNALNNQMTAGGLTAKQYSAALRGLPAQFTDIFVSLSTGQRPFMVLLQQGGQIKDMFGGIGPALKATTAELLKFVNPATVLMTVLSTLGYAMYSAEAEINKFENILIRTGGAAGTSAEALVGLRNNVAAVTGYANEASAAVEKLAGSGKMSFKEVESAAQAMADYMVVTGQKADEVASKFERAFEDPIEGAKLLNDRFNFLTEAVANQIVALQKHGRTTEAAALLMREAGNASAEARQQMVANAGPIEAAWHGIKEAILGAWQALVQFYAKSREVKINEAYDERIAQLGAIGQLSAKTLEDEENARAAALAKAKEQTKADEKRVETTRKVNKILSAGAKAMRASGRSGRSRRSGGAGRTAPEVSEYQNLTKTVQQRMEALKQEIKYGEKLTEAEKLRIQIENNSLDGRKKLTEAHKKELLIQVDKLRALEKERDAKKFMSDYDKALAKDKQKLIRTYEDEIAVIGMGAKEAELYKKQQDVLRTAEDKYQEALKKHVSEGTAQKILSDARERVELMEKQKELLSAQYNDPWLALRESVRNYKEEAMDTGKQIRDAYKNTFSAMEDAFVKFTTTGKMSFKDLVNSILQDIARMMAKKAVSNLLEGILQIGGSVFSDFFGNSGVTQTMQNNVKAMNNSGIYQVQLSGRASGGPVSGGSPYVVGEKGPELFVPKQSGTIIKNEDLKGQNGLGMGGFNIHIDHRNEGTQQQVTDSGADFDGKNLIIKIVTQDIANDGMISRTMSKTFGMRRAAGAM